MAKQLFSTWGYCLELRLVSLPLLFLILPVLLKSFRRLHWLRSILILGILAVFFAGSTYISRRAGGGYDLHNYDTFILLLFITGFYAGFGFIIFDRHEEEASVPALYTAVALVILVVIPVAFAIRKTRAGQPKLSQEQTSKLLAQLNEVVGNVDPSQGPILFIDQRQLIVYDMIPGIHLYQPYDKIELMEMAMANNHPYRDEFRNAIENHTFPLIISEVHADAYQNSDAQFAYESNVWFDDVSFPILKNYQRIYLNVDAGIGVYQPVKK